MTDRSVIFVRRAVRSYVRRRRLVNAVRALGIAALLVVAWLWIMTAVDRRLAVAAAGRVAAVATVALLVAAITARPLLRVVRRRFDAVAAATEIEGLRPELDGRLVTVSSERSGSPAMLDRLWSEVADRIGRPTPSWRTAVVPWVLVIASLVRLPDPRLVARVVLPWRHDRPVTDTRLDVTPGPDAVVLDNPWVVACDADPPPADGPVLHTSTDGRTWSDWPMTLAGGQFTHTWARLESDLYYTVTAGDAASERAVVRCLRPPGVVELRIHCQYPAYLRRPPSDQVAGDLNLNVPAGTSVSVDVVTTAPLARAVVAFSKTRVEAAGNRLTFTASHDDRGELRLTGVNGLISVPRPVVIRAVADSPPAIRIGIGPFDQAAGKTDVIPVRYDSADDRQIDRVLIEARVNNREFGPVATNRVGEARVSAVCGVDLSLMRVSAGDVVAFRATAVDSAGQTSRSEVVPVLIVDHQADPNLRRAVDDLSAALEWLDRSPPDYEAARACLDRAGVSVDAESSHAVAIDLLGRAKAAAIVQTRGSLEPINRRRWTKDRLLGRLNDEARSTGYASVDDLRLLATAWACGTFPPPVAAPIDPPRPAEVNRPRTTEMPGYEEQLRLYFEHLTGKKPMP